LKVGHRKTGSETGAFRRQKIMQPATIAGAPQRIDDEPGLRLEADVPGDRSLGLDAGWQVELEASALEGDRVAAGQTPGTRHVTSPGAPLRHGECQRHAART